MLVLVLRARKAKEEDYVEDYLPGFVQSLDSDLDESRYPVEPLGDGILLSPPGTDGLFLAVKYSKALATKVRHAAGEGHLINKTVPCLNLKLASLDVNLHEACLVLGEEYEPLIHAQYETVR